MSEYPSAYHPSDEEEITRFVLFCGRLAPFFSILLFLSPIPTIRQVLRTGTVGDLPLLPYSSMVASTFVWVVYGLLKREPLIWGTNLIELVLSIYYFVEFTNYAPKESSTFPGSVFHHIKGVGGIALATVLAALMGKSVWIGDLTVLLSILTFASPLAALKAVFESQSSESIPWPFTIATLMNCTLWTVVGVWEMHDIYVYFPEVLGLLLGFTQVALKLHFGDLAKQDNPTFHNTGPVEMPFPVLSSLRQVVMLGNTVDGENNIYSNDDNNNPQLLLESNANYMPIHNLE